ncbi:MAG TPA: hypothetical protein VGL20_09560 [Candidatus Dormibacteraeota bacterium]|jgi:hypothetical protein
MTAVPPEVTLVGAAAETRPAPAWPEGIPAPPRPGGESGTLAGYASWLSGVAEVLRRRVDTNAAELERLAAEWNHVLRNLQRLRPEEISAVVEAQARVREVIAADGALHQLIELQRREVAGWAEALGGPRTDAELVGRLLDGATAERAQVTTEMFEVTAEAITGVVLDLEVVRREALREPERAAVGLFEVGRRLTGVAEDLRERARAADLRPAPGESLPAALRRCAQALGTRLRATVVWRGSETVGAAAAAALPPVVEECLRHLAATPGTEAEVVVSVSDGGGVLLRVTTPGDGLLPGGDERWLERARARAALAGGRLLCGPAGDGSLMELHL